MTNYENKRYDKADGTGYAWGGRKQSKVYDSGLGSKKDALENFKILQITLSQDLK